MVLKLPMRVPDLGTRLMLLSLVGVMATTAACSRFGLTRKTAAERSLPFTAKMDDQKDGTLVVTVRAGGAGLEAARESARFPVTNYCLTRRGSSDAIWTMDPATGDWAYSRDEKGDLTLTARCRA